MSLRCASAERMSFCRARWQNRNVLYRSKILSGVFWKVILSGQHKYSFTQEMNSAPHRCKEGLLGDLAKLRIFAMGRLECVAALIQQNRAWEVQWGEAWNAPAPPAWKKNELSRPWLAVSTQQCHYRTPSSKEWITEIYRNRRQWLEPALAPPSDSVVWMSFLQCGNLTQEQLNFCYSGATVSQTAGAQYWHPNSFRMKWFSFPK